MRKDAKRGSASYVEHHSPRGQVLITEAFGVVGTTEHGKELGVELRLAGGALATVIFPSRLFTKLMSALMAAGRAAHAEKLAYLGNEQAVVDLEGVEPFAPSGFQIAHTTTRDGEPVILMRMEKDGVPVVDLSLTPALADQLVRGVATELARPPPAGQPRQ